MLFRPPVRFSGSVRLFSGVVFVTSSNVETLMKRRPGLVGLYFLRAIRLVLLRRSRSFRPRLHLEDVHVLDVDLEELLDGLAHLRLVRVLVHPEGVLAVGDQAVALLRDDRSEQHFVRVEAHVALPCTSGSAASVISRLLPQITVATSSSDGTVTSVRGRLRKDLISVSSSSVATRTSGVSLPHDSTRPLACFVDGDSKAEPSTMAIVPLAACWERALRSAERRALRLTLTSKLRIVGAKTTPPPVNWAARTVPARARPVPFWRHGL